jgi:IclR family transcriptional regulator, acetate operon repressor
VQPSDPDASRRAPAEHIVGRALTILSEIGRSSDPIGVAGLSRRTGLPKSTVHRLLTILGKYHAVERGPRGYRLGPASLELGMHAEQRDEMLRRLVMPHLVELYAHVGEAVSLAVLRDDAVVYLETLYDRTQRTIIQLTEQRAPVHATSAGKLLLAYQPALLARLSLDVSLPELTDYTITTPGRLARELARVRRDGMAFSREEYVTGMVSVAAGVVGRRGLPIAAITVGGPRTRMDLAAVIAEVREATRTASAALR